MAVVPAHLDVVAIDPDHLADTTRLSDLLCQFTYLHSATQHVSSPPWNEVYGIRAERPAPSSAMSPPCLHPRQGRGSNTHRRTAENCALGPLLPPRRVYHRDFCGGLVAGRVEPLDGRHPGGRCRERRQDVIPDDACITGRDMNDPTSPHGDDRTCLRPSDFAEELAVRQRSWWNPEVEELSPRLRSPPEPVAGQFVAGLLAQCLVIGAHRVLPPEHPHQPGDVIFRNNRQTPDTEGSHPLEGHTDRSAGRHRHRPAGHPPGPAHRLGGPADAQHIVDADDTHQPIVFAQYRGPVTAAPVEYVLDLA